MDSFSYTDNVRAALASCLPCFGASPDTAPLSEPRSTVIGPSSANDLEHLLRDADSDVLSLHSNLGAPVRRRAKRHKRPKFSLTLFGYTLFGRPPIYLSDDDDDDSPGRARALATASSSTFDSDAAPLDASAIERLTSPDHYAALAAQREQEQQQLEAEGAARRRAERRARRQERKVRERAKAIMSLTGTSPRGDADTFEGFQGSGDGITSSSFSPHQALLGHRGSDTLSVDGVLNGSHSGDADDADLGGELYTRKKKPSAASSASGSDSRSHTSLSLSVGDASRFQNFPIRTTHQSVPYTHAEMRLPAPVKKKSHRISKRTSILSSVTSQSTSTAPYTPVESIAESPAVAASPVPQERYLRDGERADFPSVGLSGKRGPPNLLDPRTFLAHQA